MPGRVTEISEQQDVFDLQRDRRRQAAATTSVQMPQPAKDTFTVAATPATTYTLNAIPYQGSGGSSLNLSLNGLELLEGVDYTVDYTTAIVTVSATLKGTPTPADVLTADYWTTGDLIALTGAADTGPSSASTFWRISSNQAAASPFGGGTWAAAYVDSGVTHNDFQSTIATVSSGEMNLATLKPDGTQRCGVQVNGGTIQLIYGALGASGNYLGSDPSASVASAPATPFTLRVALTGSVLSCWINGVLQGATLTVDSTSMITYGASTKIGMLDTNNGVWDDFMTSDGTTVVDHFTRADTTSGLGTTNTGQVWVYYP